MAATDALMAIGVLITSMYGAQVTEHRMRKYGVGVELSRLLTWLASHMGIDLAIALGIMVPIGTAVSFGVVYHLSGLLGFLLGYQLLHAKFQYLSLQFEPEIDKVRAESTASTSKPQDAQ